MRALLVEVRAGVTDIEQIAYLEIGVTAERLIDEYTHRTFEPALTTGNDVDRLYDLPPYSLAYIDDAVEITEVSVRGTDLDPTEWTLLNRGGKAENQGPAAQWTRVRRLDVNGLALNWSYPFVGPTIGQLRIKARWGFDEATPLEVAAATLQTAVWIYKGKPYLYLARDNPDLVGGGDEENKLVLPDEIKKGLDHLVKPDLCEIV
jgi:hypothetical protein